MKQITQGRIRKTIALINDTVHRKTEVSGNVVRSMALQGMRSFCGATTPSDSDRIGLELDYLGVPKNEGALRSEMDDFFHQCRRYGDRRDWVWRIQRKHEVSGLVQDSVKLGDRTIPRLWTDDDLAVIESDLVELRKEKPRVVEQWLDYCILNNLVLYVKKEVWEPCDLDVLKTAIAFYDWANFWEHISYTSPSRLKSRGYDEMRRQPKYPDDKKSWEVHLLLGCGTYMDSPENSIWFCAANCIPSN